VVSDASAIAEAAQLANGPAAGQRLAHVEVPVTKNRIDEAVDRLGATNDEVKAELRPTPFRIFSGCGRRH
jgi:hypothetical protein